VGLVGHVFTVVNLFKGLSSSSPFFPCLCLLVFSLCKTLISRAAPPPLSLLEHHHCSCFYRSLLPVYGQEEANEQQVQENHGGQGVVERDRESRFRCHEGRREDLAIPVHDGRPAMGVV
jgi:hypothetical protein